MHDITASLSWARAAFPDELATRAPSRLRGHLRGDWMADRARRVMRHDSNDWQNECMRLRNDRDSVKDSGALYMKYLNA